MADTLHMARKNTPLSHLSMSTAGTPTDARGLKRLCTDMARKTIIYLLALAVLYISVVATINLIGIDVENLRRLEVTTSIEVSSNTSISGVESPLRKFTTG